MDARELKAKSVQGIAAIGRLGLLTKVTGFVGGIFLARWLVPEDYGIFAVVGFVLGFFKLFADVGFAASLIQKKEETGAEEASSIFFFQGAAVLVLFLAACAVTPWIPDFYPAFAPEYAKLLYVLAAVFVIDSLKSVPKAILSRNVEFKAVSRIELIENYAYWACALILAYFGFRVWALILAVTVRTAIGTALFFLWIRWRPAWGFSFAHVRRHWRFGIEYQTSRILDFARNSVSPTVISYFFGVKFVGYVSWASALAMTPYFIVAAIDRVCFSLYARLQENADELRDSVLKASAYTAYVVFPLLAVLVVFTGEIIRFVYLDQWLPAERLLRIYAVNYALVCISYPLYTCLVSLGRNRLLILIGIAAFAIEMGATFLLKGRIGVESIAAAQTLSVAIQIVMLTWFLFKDQRRFYNIFTAALWPGLIVGSLSAVFWKLKNAWAIESLWSLMLHASAFLFAYFLCLLAWRRDLLSQARRFLR